MDQNYPSGDQAHEGRFIRHGIARGQLLSLERVLEGIEAQLRSEEVRMVMGALRDAKTFHATVSVIIEECYRSRWVSLLFLWDK